MTNNKPSLPEFTPELSSFRSEEFLLLSETLLAIPLEQDQARLNAAPFRLSTAEPLPEKPLPALPPRRYPRPDTDMIAAARAALAPPPRPLFMHGRETELVRVLRPLLAGEPVCLRGEPGAGKTTLLAAVAAHERTRQRFRYIWWIDRPAQLDQTLALALNMPHALAERDPSARRAWLTRHFDEHTLLIIDNVDPDDPALAEFASLERVSRLTPHVLVALEAAPSPPDPDAPLPDDPAGVVTLYALADDAAAETLAHYAGLDDIRRIRADLRRVALLLGNHPYALMLAGQLMQRDGLSLAELETVLALDADAEEEISAGDEAESGGEADEEPFDVVALPATHPSLIRALDVSLEAMPGSYRHLFEAFGAFPPEGAPFEGLHATAHIGTPLATRRGLVVLEQYGLVRCDHRDPARFFLHPVAYARAASGNWHGPRKAPGKRMRTWALRCARDHADDFQYLYRVESALLFAQAHSGDDMAIHEALRPYLRDFRPDLIDDTARESDDLTGPRREGTHLTAYGLELTDQGAFYAAEETLDRALALREKHDSPHAIAETLVALGRLYDQRGDPGRAAEALLRAAELVYELGADSSLSVVRRGLARLYRHMGRLSDALNVLDESPEAHHERAFILRAQGQYAAAVHEMQLAGTVEPYVQAETLLLAGRYDEALDAIAHHDDPASAHLRAQVYHLQGRADDAIQGYELALAACEPDDPARPKILRGLGAALAAAEHYDQARATLESALTDSESALDPLHEARTLRLLAAVSLAAGNTTHAAEIAQQAIVALEPLNAPEDMADSYRTLGRALLIQNMPDRALGAFNQELEHAQATTPRDDTRIGLALFHLAGCYFHTGSLDRAVANYRRALTHLNPASDPHSAFITLVGLHRSLTQQERHSVALDVSQEIIDLLQAHQPVDLFEYGYALALRTRTQQAMLRPIRANQTLMEWAHELITRADDVFNDPRPALRVLLLGLATRSLHAGERPAEALPLAEHGLEVAELQFPENLTAYAARRDLGEVYAALERWEEAIITLEPLLSAETRSRLENTGQMATYALAAACCGQAYHAGGNHEQALAHLRIAFETEPEQHLRGLLMHDIGEIQLEIGQPAAAVESFRMAVSLFDQGQHPDVVARVLTVLAHTLGGLNRYAEAIDVYEEALTALREVEGVSPVHTADVLRSLGQTHEAQGQPTEAAGAYRRALVLLERVEAPHQTRDILHLLARVAASLGDPTAVQLYEETRALTHELGDAQQLGSVLCELANVHRDAARLGPAIQNYQAALDCQPAPPFLRERVHTLRNMGRALSQMERFDDARAAWTEALALSRDLPDSTPVEIALTHHAIAEAHRSQQQFTEAEAAFREALTYHQPHTVEAAATWRAMGQALLGANRPADAIEALLQALEAEKAQPQQANARIVHTLQLLADAYEVHNDLQGAITRHHEALVYMDRRLQPVAFADTLRTLGRLYGDDQNYDQAHQAYNEALNIEGSLAPRSDERISETLQAIANTYRAAGDLEAAAETYQKVTVYANMARRASQDLRETLDELERRRATLQAAQQSLALLDRSDAADLKDKIFIYALIAHSEARLNQPEASASTIRTLLDELMAHHDRLDAKDIRPDHRALAWLAAARLAEEENDIPAALHACQTAQQSAQNANLRWVIEQIILALSGE